MLFVQVDLTKMRAESQPSFIADLVTSCHKNKIDGIVLRQTTFDDEARIALQTIRTESEKIAKKVKETKPLIVMSEGRQITTGEQVEERLQAGATLTTTCDPFFLKKGPFTIYDIKKELVALRKASTVKE